MALKFKASGSWVINENIIFNYFIHNFKTAWRTYI